LSNNQESATSLWDAAAANFDDEPDHGLRDPAVRTAWRNLLALWLPRTPGRAIDIGCGTGSLSILLGEMGHAVTGIDFSAAMLEQAQTKARAAGQRIDFQIMNAAQPRFAPQQFDMLVCRHLLWAFPAPAQLLTQWAQLLVPGGRMLLVEGFWATGAGLHAEEVVAALPTSLTKIAVVRLSAQAALWGRATNDERYAIIADRIGHKVDHNE
jgi:ubiquinone/menaquinone biosynthesis C-methylase UbiE